MKKRIYYAVCFCNISNGGKTITHDDPVEKGAFALFYNRAEAIWNTNEDDKIVRVLVTIEPVPSKKKVKK